MTHGNIKNPRLLDFIYEVQKKIGIREAGSREEKLLSRYIKNILKETSDHVSRDSFTCDPRGYQHNVNILCITYCIALLFYFISPITGFIISTISFLNFEIYKRYYFSLIDIFNKKSKSQNVISKVNSVKEAKRKIIFISHIDSPFINILFETQYKKYITLIKDGITLSFISLILISLSKFLSETNNIGLLDTITEYFYLIPFFCILIIILFQHIIVTYHRTFGANDSLTGSTVMLSLAKHFHSKKLDNTELWFCFLGASKSGFYGSRHFYTKYKDQLKNAYIINLSSLSGIDICNITKEIDSGVIFKNKLIKKLKLASKNSNIPVKNRFLKDGRTDAGIFARGKIPSLSIMSLDHNGLPLRSLSRDDLPQFILEEQLQNSYKLCMNLIESIDKE